MSKFKIETLHEFTDQSWRDFRNLIGQRKALKYRKSGMNHLEADEAAVKCGAHPIEVWGESWLENE